MTYDSRPDTHAHINKVQEYLEEVVDEIKMRSFIHDDTKLHSPEKEAFDRAISLKTVEYGTPEYDAAKASLGDALAHHYAHNSHHPEHYENGINGMSLLDVIEMLADWKAATERMKDGDLGKSLEINKERFGISDQLYEILVNTAKELEWL